MKKALLALFVVVPLAGCMAPQARVAPVAPVAPLPMVAPVAGISGLQAREPDACNARNYTSVLGQPGSMIAGLGVDGDYRVVEYRGIEPQEYKAARIVFRLDQVGNVSNVDCG